VRSDADLVRAVLGGEKQAFADLVRRYEKSVHAIALNVLGNHHGAEDACQIAFVKAYEKLAKLRKRASFGLWLMRIARRAALDLACGQPEEKPLESKFATAAESPDSRLDEDNWSLLREVMKLAKSERQVVMLRHFGDHSLKEIAGITGRGIGTVSKQLSRAHSRLRKMLKESEL